MLDFDASKRAMLKKLEQVKKEKQAEKRSQEVRKKVSSKPTPAYKPPSAPKASPSNKDKDSVKSIPKSNKALCLLFTHNKSVKTRVGSFLESLADVAIFNKPETALDWAMDHNPKFIFLDIDTPTPWTEAMDVFTNGSIALPNSKFITITGDPLGSINRQMSKKNLYAVLRIPIAPTSLRLILQDKMPPGAEPVKN